MRNVCKNVSSRPTGLFCRFCWNESACLPPVRKLPSAYSSLPLRATSRPPAAPFTQLFSQSLFSHTLYSCLEIVSTTNNLCNFWHSKFQQVSTYALCSWDDIFTQKWNCTFPNNLCKCTKSTSTLSANTSIEWNLYFSSGNHLVSSFRLEMNIGSFPEQQNKTSDTGRYKWYFFTNRVSQVNVNSMKRNFEQRSELQVAKCLIIHVLSSSYNVSRLELRNKKKATQQWSLSVANDNVLNQLGIYHERVYANSFVSKLWFVRSFSSQQYSKFITNIISEHVSQIRTKECKTGSFICKVNLNFLRSSRHFNFDTVFAVIVSFLSENVRGFINIRNGRVQTRFQVIEIWWIWKFLVKKHKFSLRNILVHWWIGYFWNCNLRLTIQIQLLW